MEFQDLRFRAGTFGFNGNLAQVVHDGGDIDVVGTSHRACITSGAHPNGDGIQRFFPLADSDGMYDLMGKHVHFFDDGAAGGALGTLVTIRGVFVNFGK